MRCYKSLLSYRRGSGWLGNGNVVGDLGVVEIFLLCVIDVWVMLLEVNVMIVVICVVVDCWGGI